MSRFKALNVCLLAIGALLLITACDTNDPNGNTVSPASQASSPAQILLQIACNRHQKVRVLGISRPASCVSLHMKNTSEAEAHVESATLNLYSALGEEFNCDWQGDDGNEHLLGLPDRVIRPHQEITLKYCCPRSGIPGVIQAPLTEEAASAEYHFCERRDEPRFSGEQLTQNYSEDCYKSEIACKSIK